MHRAGYRLWSGAACLLAAVLGGCGDEVPNISGLDPAIVSSVEVQPRLDTIFVADTAFAGDTVRFQAAALLMSGQVRSDVPFVWETTDSAVARVNQDGTVFPVGYGTIRVLASAGEQGSATLVVAPTVVQALTVTPTAVIIVAGDAVQLTATVTDAAGHPVAGVAYGYSSSAPNVASVDGVGLVRGLAPGTATIMISGSGLTQTVQVTVTSRSFAKVDAGGDHSCGVLADGRLYCWGLSNADQLGTEADSSCFADGVVADTLKRDRFPCSLNPDRVAPDLTFRTVSAGDSLSCGITTDGRARCWGSDIFGGVGNGSEGANTRPALVTSALAFASLSVGDNFACGIATDGRTFCWGRDSDGQLGDRRLINSTTPIPVVDLPEALGVVSAGEWHACGLTVSGAAYCWGRNDTGQLGNGSVGGRSEVAVAVAGSLRFTAISAGSQHSCAITAGGDAYCWGSNATGQLGTGGAATESATPVRVAGTGFTLIAAGGQFTCGIANGDAYCWGDGTLGQLGSGIAGASTPTAVAALPNAGAKFTILDAGIRHTCGSATDGVTYCWGSNVFGSLGDSFQAAFRHTPQAVTIP